jgi:hypothetical protein
MTSSQISAFVMDNATNNDTMLVALEGRCRAAGIKFSAEDARGRCMPHTIHLSAITVRLEVIYSSIPIVISFVPSFSKNVALSQILMPRKQHQPLIIRILPRNPCLPITTMTMQHLRRMKLRIPSHQSMLMCLQLDGYVVVFNFQSISI